MSKRVGIFLVPRPVQHPRARVFCFPYAGGSASLFLQWVEAIPSDIELVLIQLPGRGARLGEKAHTTMADIVVELLAEADFICSEPFYFFGHSLGSRVAYELSCQLHISGRRIPECLFVSASRAPHLPTKQKQIHHLPKQEFLAALAEMSGTPEEVLSNTELMELCIPFLRADFKVVELYEANEHVLPCPIHVLAGKDDTHFTQHELEAWRQLTINLVAKDEFPGGHFYIHDQMDEVISLVLKSIS